jgi:SAM-dependent methyltransferase
MTDEKCSAEPLGRRAYASFADRYSALAPTKPHNALCERPASLDLLGEVRDLHVLDAGCGPGICSEVLARQGASVHGFDVTPEMIDLARHRCAGLAVEFVVGNLEQPLHWLPDRHFDKVLCALALDYVATLAPVFAEFRRVTRPRGILVFSMSHPMRDWMDGRTHGEGDPTYHDTRRFGMHWGGFGEPRPYVESYRRPLAAILNPLADSGWRFDRIVEPQPVPAARDVSERDYLDLSRSPAFICMRATAA